MKQRSGINCGEHKIGQTWYDRWCNTFLKDGKRTQINGASDDAFEVMLERFKRIRDKAKQPYTGYEVIEEKVEAVVALKPWDTQQRDTRKVLGYLGWIIMRSIRYEDNPVRCIEVA